MHLGDRLVAEVVGAAGHLGHANTDTIGASTNSRTHPPLLHARSVAPVEHDTSNRPLDELATVRFETAPGHQMQIDFGEKWISIAGLRTKVHRFVAVLGYSRRIFVRASLSQRQDDWREGVAGTFRTFGGVT